jgi:hypothetical protein
MGNSSRKDGAETPREPFAAEYFGVIEECIDAGAEWVKFVDLTGARIRLRTRMINYITQYSADQRAMERDFNRRLRGENDAEEDWNP